MNITFIHIVQGTPAWVFVLFGYLVWIGIKRLQPSVRPFNRLFIVPAVFVAWGLLGLFESMGPFVPTLVRWVVAAVPGVALGAITAPRLQRDRQRDLIRLPPSVIPLCRNVAIFAAHYVLRVAAAIDPHARDALLAWDICVSGASAGYFIGWTVRCLQFYRMAPHTDLDADLNAASTSVAATDGRATQHSNSVDQTSREILESGSMEKINRANQ